nr:two-component system regulatory protein YycI [Ectobacillus ponti]
MLVQFLQKRNDSQVELMTETSVEEQLEADKITYVDLPKEQIKETYISGKSRVFKEADLKGLRDQTASLSNTNTMLYAKLKEPISVPKSDRGYFFEEFLRTYVLDGPKYKYWRIEQKEGKIYFFQQYKGKNIFHNEYAQIQMNLNDHDEIVSYTQTMLTDITELGGKDKAQNIITAIKALEALYLKNNLKSGDRVTKVELGYYTVVPYSAGIQVIAPTWHFVVNGKDDYFINAVEGQIIKMDKDNS